MSHQLKNVPRGLCVMDAGDLAPWIVAYTAELATLRHTRLTVANYADSARHFAAWLRRANITLTDMDRTVIDRFACHTCRCDGRRRGERLSRRYVRRVQCFITFLINRGLMAPLTMPVADPVDAHVEEYQHWLTRHHGIRESTAKRHGCMITRLLAELGHDPRTYDVGLIRRTILTEARQCSPSYVQTITTALRGYLRFLAAAGLCSSGLEGAVPQVPHWRLSSLPRYLDAADVERLIVSCDLGTGHGTRDRAVLLLLARLGLRAGDIRNMHLGDIDWMTGTVLVRGKGRREVRLPLPQEVGDALLAYIDQARPPVDDQRLFLRSCAPYRPFASSAAIAGVVRLALQRAAIANPPSRGANLLRHSAATALLRGGVTLQTVGAVLRHRSLDTTAHYAKVNLPMLQQIAQPWPGAGSC